MSVLWMYVILVACLIEYGRIQGAPSKQLDVSESVTQFSVELFKTIITQSEINVVVSPLSVWEACLLAYYGAAGSTEVVLKMLLHLKGEKKTEIAASVKKFNDALKSLKKDQFNITLANRVYIDRTLPAPVKRTEFVSEKELVKMDLTKNPHEDINAWVNEVTNGKIKSIFKNPLSTSDRMVILNAVYLKGIWMSEFDPERTSEGVFHVTGEKRVKVQFMRQTEHFDLATSTDLKAEVLKMPYQGEGVSMYVFLPNDKHGSVKEMAAKISPSFISALEFKQAETHVVLPKFKIEQDIDLKDSLKQLGAEEIFASVQLPGFTNYDGLSVSKVKQNSYIEVEEKGTEAAAVTAMVLSDGFSDSKLFRCDHPFMFVIHDDTNKVPLFMGIVTDPSVPA